jgi:hypothetical protein
MLKNHLGVVLPRIPEKSCDPYAACKQRDHGRWFGKARTSTMAETRGVLGTDYEEVVGQAIFNGGEILLAGALGTLAGRVRRCYILVCCCV